MNKAAQFSPPNNFSILNIPRNSPSIQSIDDHFSDHALVFKVRLGWAITRDPALREQLVLGKFNTVISCSPVCEALALKVLEKRESIITQRRRSLVEGLARMAERVLESKEFIDWIQPDAGAICCLCALEAFGL